MAILLFSFLLIISNVIVYKGLISRSSKLEASRVCKISVEKYASIMKIRNVSCNFTRDLQTTFAEFVLYCKLIYNHFHNIFRLAVVLPNFPFTTSETMGDYYL